jgi:hypothetical protein
MTDPRDDSKAPEWAKRWLRNYFKGIVWILGVSIVLCAGVYVAFFMHASSVRDSFAP